MIFIVVPFWEISPKYKGYTDIHKTKTEKQNQHNVEQPNLECMVRQLACLQGANALFQLYASLRGYKGPLFLNPQTLNLKPYTLNPKP